MAKKRGGVWKKLVKVRRSTRRLWRRHRRAVVAVSLFAGILLLVGIYSLMTPPRINQQAYQPLLNTIAAGESKGNYDAYFGKPANTELKLTEMTVKQVMAWQETYVSAGSKSSAAGKYQIIRPTLAGLVHELEIDENLPFDAALQDRLAIALIERRGSVDYADQKISREQFAANLAKEWAAMPRVLGGNPDDSYYAGDGLNKARISVDEVYDALTPIKF